MLQWTHMSAIIRVKGLSKAYGDNIVVDDLTFDVQKGEIFGILGPNGAGKTTTLEMIETLRPIDAGTVHVNGFDVTKKEQAVKSIVGVQPQSPAFQDKTTLVELLTMFGAAYGMSVKPLELLEKVQLQDKAKSFAENLSGGQRQRFSIAAALVHRPKVLFMDEPTTGLDPQARRHLWELIQAIRADGVTVVLTTHYMEEAELLCDRVAIMDGGKILVIDSPKNLVHALLGRGFIKKVHPQAASLEDVFIDLTGKELRD